MRGRHWAVVLGLATTAAGTAAAQRYAVEDAPIVTSDIDRFWTAYDRLAEVATYQDSLRVLFEGYYLPGTPGLHDFIRSRIGSVLDLLDVLKKRPRYYASIRAPTLRVREFEPALRASLGRWLELVPDATFPAIYLVVGIMSSGGTTSRDRILIGAEMYGRTANMPVEELGDWHLQVLRPVEDVPYIVAHELIHTQQAYRRDRRLLAQALTEGIADFLGEMISDGNINDSTYAWASPREDQLWRDFQQVMQGTERMGWLYGRRRPEEPSDLGYWMGYKIARAYYERAEDKRQAVRDMLTIQDFDAFLEASEYGRPTSSRSR